VASRPKYEVHVARAARRDIIAILDWRRKEFGEDAALRYDALMAQALSDIGNDPERPGVQQRLELAHGVLVYHLRFSCARAQSALGVVRNPWHFVIYRRRPPASIEILRIIHDSRDLARHLPEEHRRVDAGED
jgi:toxin ParE1/3/4